MIAAQERGDDEQPQLRQGRAALEQGRAERSGRVDAGVRDRDRDEVDQGQHEADPERRHALGRRLRRDAEDHHEEQRGQQHLGDERPGQVVEDPAAVLAVRVRRERSLADGEATRPARLDRPEGRHRDDRTDALDHHVRRDVTPLEPLRRREAERDGRVEVPAGHVTERVGAAQHRETEREGDPEVPDARVHDSGRADLDGTDVHVVARRGECLGREDRRAAPSEDQDERADELSAKSFCERHGRSSRRLPAPGGCPARCRGGTLVRVVSRIP